MKRTLSLLFVVFAMIGLLATVGCNGLWDFDDDDDYVAPTTSSFTLSSKLALDNVETGLLAAVASGTAANYSALKAELYKRATVTTASPTLVATSTLTATGSFSFKFVGYQGNYFVKITNTSGTLELYEYIDNLLPTTTTLADVTEETTAIGIVIQLAKNDGRIVTAADMKTELTNKGVLTTLVTKVENGVKTLTGTSALKTDTDFVNAAKVAVTGVSLNKSTLTLPIGSSETLVATVLPTDATDKSVTWSSSNTSVATVDSTGKVTAVATGSATITVTTTDGSKTATCVVTVVESQVAVTGVSLNKSTLSLNVGGSETLVATVSPTNATDKSVTWSSSNTSVATVDSTGKVTAVAAGNATITVTTTDGSKTATCVVTVTASTTGNTVTFDKTVSGATIADFQIHITGVAADFTTTTTVNAGGEKTIEKSDSLTNNAGHLVLTYNGLAFDTIDDFNSLAFSTAIPSGATVEIKKSDGTVLATATIQ